MQAILCRLAWVCDSYYTDDSEIIPFFFFLHQTSADPRHTHICLKHVTLALSKNEKNTNQFLFQT